jgi:ribosomal protein S13
MFLFRDFTLDINKEIRNSLSSIYGVGLVKSNSIITRLGLAYPFCLRNLNVFNFSIIFYLLKNLVVSDVRIKRRISFDISKLQDNLSHKGIRHKLCLPFMASVLVQMHLHNVVNVYVYAFFLVLKN